MMNDYKVRGKKKGYYKDLNTSVINDVKKSLDDGCDITIKKSKDGEYKVLKTKVELL